MSTPIQKESRFLYVTLWLGLCILGAATIALVTLHRKDAEELSRLRDWARQQSEERDQALAQLKAVAKTNMNPPTVERENAEMTTRLAEVSMLQTQTLALIKAVGEKVGAAPSIQQSEAYRKAGLELLTEEKAKFETRVADLKQRTADLERNLKVPDNVAMMPTYQALQTPSLKVYRAYFEARRDQENLEAVLERLKMRLIQEEVEDRIRARAASSRP